MYSWISTVLCIISAAAVSATPASGSVDAARVASSSCSALQSPCGVSGLDFRAVPAIAKVRVELS